MLDGWMRFWTNCFLCFVYFFKKDVNANHRILKSKKRFEYIEFPAKLLNYFSRSNKSNINQSRLEAPCANQMAITTGQIKKNQQVNKK